MFPQAKKQSRGGRVGGLGAQGLRFRGRLSVRSRASGVVCVKFSKMSLVSGWYLLCSNKVLIRPFSCCRPECLGKRRAQRRSRLAEGHRRRRREATLTAASTALSWGGSATRLLLLFCSEFFPLCYAAWRSTSFLRSRK